MTTATAPAPVHRSPEVAARIARYRKCVQDNAEFFAAFARYAKALYALQEAVAGVLALDPDDFVTDDTEGYCSACSGLTADVIAEDAAGLQWAVGHAVAGWESVAMSSPQDMTKLVRELRRQGKEATPDNPDYVDCVTEQ